MDESEITDQHECAKELIDALYDEAEWRDANVLDLLLALSDERLALVRVPDDVIPVSFLAYLSEIQERINERHV